MDTIVLQVILQGIMVGMVYGLIAMGMTLVFSVSGLMNFAHGSLLAVAMYAAISLYTAFGLDPYVSVFITIPALFVIGWLLFRFLLSRMLQVHVMMAAQVTIGLIWIIGSIQSTIYGNDSLSAHTFLSSNTMHFGPLAISAPYVVAFVSAAVVAILLFLVMQKTDFGRSIRALMQNRTAAALMGIQVGRVQTAVFAIGVALLGLAGPLVTPMIPISPNSALHFSLLAFIIMILGGSTNILGCILGGLIFGVVDSLARFYSTGNVASIIPYAMLMIVVLFRPQGLLGGKTR